ncbi:hypothetical protein THRCLA_10220 [Thraustotheca clavata]|uniref:M96 mating-specific protein family n=1 Tax=Thraustotheca clavata TaxID=74557 RepID=A0A1V9YSM2_9STRA|nr:hypothetical protein THRCLA_10220 [Thraustotheca clavata]
MDLDLFPDFDLSFLDTEENNIEIPKKRIRKRHADEVAFLQATVDSLTQELQQLKAAKTKLASQSQWENVARRQATQAQLTIQKNQRLREAVEEQLQIAQSLQKIFAKKTKFTTESLYEDTYIPDVLTLDPIVRAMRMNAILDEEYEKLESTFVKYGLVEFTKSYQQSSMKDEPEHNRLVLTFAHADVIPIPFNLLSKGIWEYISLSSPVQTENCFMKRLEVVDENTVYNSAISYSGGLPTIQSNYGVKRYHVNKKLVYVFRSIANSTAASSSLWPMGDSSQWIVVEPYSDTASLVRLALYVHFPYKRFNLDLRQQTIFTANGSSDCAKEGTELISRCVLQLHSKLKETLETLMHSSFDNIVNATI